MALHSIIIVAVQNHCTRVAGGTVQTAEGSAYRTEQNRTATPPIIGIIGMKILQVVLSQTP